MYFLSFKYSYYIKFQLFGHNYFPFRRLEVFFFLQILERSLGCFWWLALQALSPNFRICRFANNDKNSTTAVTPRLLICLPGLITGNFNYRDNSSKNVIELVFRIKAKWLFQTVYQTDLCVLWSYRKVQIDLH